MLTIENPQINYLRKKYAKERLVIFTGGEKRTVKEWRNDINNALQILSKELNYDLYIFDCENDKSLSKYGKVYRYDKNSIKEAMFIMQDLVALGCKRAFVMNTDILDKRLLSDDLRYRFLFLSTIQEIYLPEIQPKKNINIGGADIFNIVKDVECVNIEKVCYCNKACLKEFKEHLFKYPDRLSYFQMDKKDTDKHFKIVDAILE